MKKINFKRGFWTVVVAVLLTTTLVSCDSFKRKGVSKNWSMEVSHPFPNTNWAFEEEVLDFDFEIKDTTKYYDVTVSLLYDTSIVALRVIPLTLTLTSPDGMQSIASSQFLLDSRRTTRTFVPRATATMPCLTWWSIRTASSRTSVPTSCPSIVVPRRPTTTASLV